MMNNNYIEWLKKQGAPLFQGGDTYWRFYHGALIPAKVTPFFVELSHDAARDLLKQSGAWFIRYTSNPSAEANEWWYMVCDSYNLKMLSSNTRSKINRGSRKCLVRHLDANWLANHGYECYLAAYSRYRNATPASEDIFRLNILAKIPGPFEYWGVFVDERLAGYCECIVEDNEVVTAVIKYNPVFLKYYSAYVLTNKIIIHYALDRAMSISNGTRSIMHDTNMQDFLLKFGFRRQFCRLNIIYLPWLGLAVKTLFLFNRFIAHLPDRGPISKIQSLLFQDEIRRKCR